MIDASAFLRRPLDFLGYKLTPKSAFDDGKYGYYETLFRDARSKDLESLFELRSNSARSSFAVYSQYCGPTAGLNLKCSARGADFPCYFVSNNDFCLEKAERLGWVPVFLKLPVEKDQLASALQTKVAKILPHRVQGVNQHPWIAYMDDKYNFDLSALHRFWLSEKVSCSFLISRHHFLNKGVLLELVESQRQPRYFHQRRKILEFLEDSNVSRKVLFGGSLFATGLMLRKQDSDQVIRFCEEWFRKVLDCGIECQISFDVLAAIEQPSWLKGFDREIICDRSSES